VRSGGRGARSERSAAVRADDFAIAGLGSRRKELPMGSLKVANGSVQCGHVVQLLLDELKSMTGVLDDIAPLNGPDAHVALAMDQARR
jgi:hypothetical protein